MLLLLLQPDAIENVNGVISAVHYSVADSMKRIPYLDPDADDFLNLTSSSVD